MGVARGNPTKADTTICSINLDPQTKETITTVTAVSADR